jgi:hypothetical protein
VHDDLKDAADGVAGTQDVIDFCLHFCFGFGVDAVEKDFLLFAQGRHLFPGSG